MSSTPGPGDLDSALAMLPVLVMPADVAAGIDAALGSSGPPLAGVTMLPSEPRGRPRTTRWLTVGLPAIAAGLILVVVAVVVTRDHSSHTVSSTGTATAVAPAQAAKTTVIADSGRNLTDSAGVQGDVADLLAGKLTAAHGLSPQALVAPRAAAADSAAAASSAAAAGASTPALGAALSLDDPALPACVQAIAEGATLLGVDRVSYTGTPALIVVVKDNSDPSAEASAYVIGRDCAAPGGDGIRSVVTVAVP